MNHLNVVKRRWSRNEMKKNIRQPVRSMNCITKWRIRNLFSAHFRHLTRYAHFEIETKRKQTSKGRSYFSIKTIARPKVKSRERAHGLKIRAQYPRWRSERLVYQCRFTRHGRGRRPPEFPTEMHSPCNLFVTIYYFVDSRGPKRSWH